MNQKQAEQALLRGDRATHEKFVREQNLLQNRYGKQPAPSKTKAITPRIGDKQK